MSYSQGFDSFNKNYSPHSEIQLNPVITDKEKKKTPHNDEKQKEKIETISQNSLNNLQKSSAQIQSSKIINPNQNKIEEIDLQINDTDMRDNFDFAEEDLDMLEDLTDEEKAELEGLEANINYIEEEHVEEMDLFELEIVEENKYKNISPEEITLKNFSTYEDTEIEGNAGEIAYMELIQGIKESELLIANSIQDLIFFDQDDVIQKKPPTNSQELEELQQLLDKYYAKNINSVLVVPRFESSKINIQNQNFNMAVNFVNKGKIAGVTSVRWATEIEQKEFDQFRLNFAAYAKAATRLYNHPSFLALQRRQQEITHLHHTQHQTNHKHIEPKHTHSNSHSRVDGQKQEKTSNKQAKIHDRETVNHSKKVQEMKAKEIHDQNKEALLIKLEKKLKRELIKAEDNQQEVIKEGINLRLNILARIKENFSSIHVATPDVVKETLKEIDVEIKILQPVSVNNPNKVDFVTIDKVLLKLNRAVVSMSGVETTVGAHPTGSSIVSGSAEASQAG